MPATDADVDETLWARMRQGDSDAFGAIFDRHATSVANYCAYRNGTFRDAEDLTSIVFLEAWRCRDRLEVREGTAIPLLFGIAAKVCSHHRRSAGRARRALALLPAPSDGDADPADLICARLDAERDAAAIARALAALPKDHRAVVELCLIAELATADAAQALGVPVGTVKSRLSRARAALRGALVQADRQTVEER